MIDLRSLPKRWNDTSLRHIATDLGSLPKRWNDTSLRHIATDLGSLPKRWNDTSLRHIATLREGSPSRRWPLVGMFAIGVVAGAVACYAVVQRSQIKRFADRALNVRDESVPLARELTNPVSITSHRSNHRRKVVEEVS